MAESQKNYWRSSLKLRFVGYVLLIISIIDFIDILIPFEFTNPVWELQTLGAFAEHAPLPLIGLVFIFIGERNYRHKTEIYLLQFLSWSSLLIGVLLILLLPLEITNTVRINNKNYVQINNQSSQQLSQIQQVKELLSKAKTNQDINQIFKSLNPNTNIPEFKNPQEVRSQILSQIESLEKNVHNQVQAMQKNTRHKLIRNSVKWNLSALVYAVAFIWIWYSTKWCRIPQ
jgi:hypothetical protein